MPDPALIQTQPEPYSTAHVVHALVQFGVAVRHRVNVVILSLVVCALLGGLYFATATRYYGAKAQLLVLQSGDEVGTSMTAQGNRQQNLMPTYENLFTSAKVLEVAIASLLPEDRIDLGDAPRDRWVEILQKEVTAKTIYNSNIIEISYSSKDPGAAVAVVNAVVRSYLAFMDETHKGTAGEIIRLLTKEKDDLTERLLRKEGERQSLRMQLGLVGTMGTNREVLHPLVQRAVSFNEALIETQKDRVSMEASLLSIRGAIRNGEDLRQHLLDLSEVVGREVMLSALGENPRDAATQAALDQLIITNQANLAALMEHCGPNHPQVATLREEIRLAEEYRRNQQKRVHERLAELQNGQLASMLVNMVEQKLKELGQKEVTLQNQYQRAYDEANQLNGQLSQLEMVEFDVKWLRDLHETLLKKLADVNLRQDGPEIRTSVVSEPVKNEKPISPSLRIVVFATLLGGLGLGLLLVYVLDTLDDRFRSVEELQSQLGAAVLSVVRPLPVRHTVGAEALQIYVEPDAAESEAFRTLRTALSLAEHESRQIVVTSTEPGDGKTTVMANLAVCYAQSAKRTLLIDADLRRPGLTTLLGMRGVDGLSSVIRGAQDVIELAGMHIRASGIAGLDVLPAGPRPTNPAELLASVRFSELLAWAETVYDQILIDSPPVLAASDAALIGRLVDGVMLVVQPAKNRRRMVMRAVEGLNILKIPLLGMVVNRVGADDDSNYYGYGSGYAYDYREGDVKTASELGETPDPLIDQDEMAQPRRVA